MTFRRQSSTSSRTVKYSNNSTQPPARNNFQYDVPAGTIASRVQLLQSLANPISARRPPSIAIRRRENSRTGFGRRLTSRFAKPASRNNNPEQQSQVETAHCFLGLNTPRKKHEEEHAMASRKGTTPHRTPGINGQEGTMFHRTPGIHGQIEPLGVRQRVQYDAASPWPVLPQAEYQQGTDPNKIHHQSQVPNFPKTSQQDNLDPHKDPKACQHETVGSETSILTTSTIRRQSVRDLFQEYGIERPAGLASSEDTPRGIDGNTHPARLHRYCHVCLWVTIRPATKCWKCGHRHCAECDALSPILENHQSNPDDATNVTREEIHSVLKPGPKENRNQVQENIRSSSASPQSKPIRETHYKQSSPPIKFPSFDAQVPGMPKASRASPLKKIALPEQPRSVRLLSGHRVTTSVKKSPFVIADMLSRGHSFAVGIPMSNNGDNKHGRHSHGAKRGHHQRSCSSSPCSADEERSDLEHEDQSKHRHPKRLTPKTYHLHEETDNGYVADSSRIEDIMHSYSHSHESRPHSQSARPLSRPNSHHSCAEQMESKHERHDHDLVECHGYPRTGHGHRGSPISSGVIGECQHCLHDCQCSACQNTHHSVRCCVHNDHQSIAHQHHTPRKEYVANPIDCPNLTPRSPSPLLHDQPGSPARTTSTVIPPNSQLKKTQTPVIEEHRRLLTPRSQAGTPMLKKTFGFLKSKESRSMKKGSKEGPKAPTPPWKSATHKTNVSTSENTLKETPKQQSIDHTFSITSSPKPPSPLQVMSNPLPPQDREVKHEQRQSYKSTPQKHSVVEGKRIPTPSRCSTPQRDNVSPPGSRRASRRLSALFQLRERNAVPLLNQKLMEHQEELKRIEKDCDESTEGFARGTRIRDPKNTQDAEQSKQIEQERSPASAASSRNGVVRKMKLKLRGDEKQSTSIYAGKEHRLSDDIVVYSGGKTSSTTCSENPGKGDETHDCLWKRMFLEEQHEKEDRETSKDGDCGIQGVTVLIHFERKDDYIFKGELSSTGTLRVKRH